MQDYTMLNILLDRSHSMQLKKEDTIKGVNQLIKEQQQQQGRCSFQLVQFSKPSDWYETYVIEDIKDVPPLTRETYNPMGTSTALIDSAVKMIDVLGKNLAYTQPSERPARVMVVIVTDGEENSSVKFKKADLNGRIKHQTEKYNWQFLFLGTNQDAIYEAAQYGIKGDHAFTYLNTTEGIAAAYSQTSDILTAMRMVKEDEMKDQGYSTTNG